MSSSAPCVETEIPASELVVDDYVILEAGRVVPADLALVQTSSPKVNESALTGESVAVEKDCSETSDEKTPLGDRKDKVFMSTLVEYGRGEGVVEKIGDHTEIGKISGMLHQIEKQETPLQKNLDSISKVLGIAGVVLCIVMFACQIFIYRTPVIETLMISIAFAVAVIPEGLATVVTLVLTAGIQEMSKRHPDPEPDDGGEVVSCRRGSGTGRAAPGQQGLCQTAGGLPGL